MQQGGLRMYGDLSSAILHREPDVVRAADSHIDE